MAALIHAALDRAEGDVASARRHLEDAVAAFERQGLRLFAAAARVRLGELTPGAEGVRLSSDGLDAFRAEGIIDPRRMVAMLSPGG